MSQKIDIADESGKVISLSVVRDAVFGRRLSGKCAHTHIEVDTLSPHLKCLDCDSAVNPVEWLAIQAQEWSRIQGLYRKYRDAKAAYEARQRCRCEHCGKITRVKPPSAAQVRAFQKPAAS